MDENVEKYWKKLSICERAKILNKYKFWDGFKDFMYRYLPDDLKAILISFFNNKS